MPWSFKHHARYSRKERKTIRAMLEKLSTRRMPHFLRLYVLSHMPVREDPPSVAIHFAIHEGDVRRIGALGGEIQVSSLGPCVEAACRTGNIDLVKPLMSPAGLRALRTYNGKLMQHLYRHQHIDMLRYMLDMGLSMCDIADNGFDLVSAVEYRGIAVFGFLFSRGLFRPCRMWDIIYHACACGNLELVQLFFTRGAEPPIIQHHDYALFRKACDSKNVALIKFLYKTSRDSDKRQLLMTLNDIPFKNTHEFLLAVCTSCDT